MRILAIDIETAPSLAHVWGLWNQNIGIHQIKHSGEMMCWAAKWVSKVQGNLAEREKDVIFHSTHSGTRKKMIKEAWKLLDDADVVLHYNGKRFDIPHLNREFLEAGLEPPSPYRQIDLLQTCKTQFKFISNKLDYVAQRLGLDGKVNHEGFDLWLKCLAKDPEAWERMREYNVQDVLELEKLYWILKPWIKQHPSYAAFTGTDVCPKCGSENLKPRGWAYTAQSRYRRLRCSDCGAWTRSTTGGETVRIVQL